MTKKLDADDLELVGLEPDIEGLLTGCVPLSEIVLIKTTILAFEARVAVAAVATEDPRQRSALEHYACILRNLAYLADGACGIAPDEALLGAYQAAVDTQDWHNLLAGASSVSDRIRNMRDAVPGWMKDPDISEEDLAAEYRYSVERVMNDDGSRRWAASVREMPEVRAWAETPGAAVSALVKEVATKILPALIREFGLVPRPVSSKALIA